MTQIYVPDLTHQESDMLDQLLAQWRAKLARNWLRTVYYDTKNTLKDLKISLPPQLAMAESMLGWPAKAVHSLASRCSFDGFVLPSQADPFELSDVLMDNDFDIELPQGITSSLVHSLAFITLTMGDVASGEPEVLIMMRSARHGTALWNRRRRLISAGLSITDFDDSKQPSELVMYLPDSVVICTKNTSGAWKVDRRPNWTGRVLVHPLVFRPELDRPFGHSRISRAVMQLTDAAVRTFVRGEVGAEFFSSPQRYLLGADEDLFDEDRWSAIIGRFLALTRSEDQEANLPTIGQFPQTSMEPHNGQMRMIASLFSGETSLPLSSLGIVHDQPASADAIYAEREDLVIEAMASTRVFGAALRNTAISAVMLRDRLSEVPAEAKKLQAKWRSPATPSMISAATAVQQQVAAVPWIADTDVVLESLGYDQATITRLLAQKQSQTVSNLVSSLRSQAAAARTDERVNTLAGRTVAVGQ